MIHIPGVKHFAADCVSRYPSDELNPDRLHLTDDVCGVSTDNLTLPTFLETYGPLPRCTENRGRIHVCHLFVSRIVTN